MHDICGCVYKSYRFLPYSSILIQFRFLVIHGIACMRLSRSDMDRLEGSEDGVEAHAVPLLLCRHGVLNVRYVVTPRKELSSPHLSVVAGIPTGV